MSMLRLSCDRTVLFAPDDRGTLVDTPFDAGTRTGRLGSLIERDTGPDVAALDSPIGAFLDQEIDDRASDLEDGEPVVVMAHGFLFDPYHIPTDNPADSDNAHSRLFHFKDMGENEEIREHSTGWPLWLGFDEADESGKTGLTVGFCWH